MRIIMIQWLFLIHFYSIFLWVDVVSVSGQCLEHQKILLLRMKESLKFDTSVSTKLVTWNQSSDCCSWKGVVSCENGRVTDLDLSSEWISDGINNSNSLFDLHHLKRLNLSDNNLNSTEFPSRFEELVNLNYLNLSNAGFSGQIPIGISRLRNLLSLDISTSYLPGIKPLKLENPNLKTLVWNLSSLEELHLDGVNISANGDDWCQALSSLPKLRVLSLSDCYLRGPIGSSLANLQSLSDVRLDNNNLSTTVPEFFADFINLTALRVSSAGLYGIFPEKIFQVPTLRAIDLRNNEMLRVAVPKFPQDSPLELLVLSNTKFSGELPYSIGDLKSLSRIELVSCNFSGFLPTSMSKLAKLVYVDLSSNNFIGPIPSFSLSTNLTELHLPHNLLNGSITSTHWEALQQLVSLDLQNNSLSGTIPSSLFSITSLRKIQLSRNRFTNMTSEFPNVSTFSLDTLDLSGNNLRGPFPMSILGLQNLKILTLSSNSYSGTFELEVINQLKNLSNLDLSYNNLSINANGTHASPLSFPQITTLKLASCRLTIFPAFLKNQSMLTYLDLSVNQIPGKIPKWIWESKNLRYLNLSYNYLVDMERPLPNFTNLDVLDLHSNMLQGELPMPSQYATYLDYSMNNFSSVIPYSIGSFLFFSYFLSLSSNNFYGGIPESICDAAYLRVLDLSNNSLSGTIPQCLTRFSESLGVMNLQMNNLSGSIPDTFQQSCSLKTLDLNGNHFSGKIPESLSNCTKLEVLNLGHNRIRDTFPCLLKKISSLRVLVLRWNYFYGDTSCQGTNGSWQMLQIVDLASNNFSGKLHPKSFLTWKAMMANNDEAESTLNRLQFQVLRLTELYYQDAVTVTIKGLEMELVKILTIFTSIDFSHNQFDGNIPDTIGDLGSLFVLNFSNNAFTGQIPTSLGKLAQLESLDLSYNMLSGMIPAQFTALTFLAVLNLSYNHLEGLIPIGNQLDTFTRDSYLGNSALCGLPLKVKCSLLSVTPAYTFSASSSCFDFQIVAAGIGYGVGAVIITAPLIFWNKGNKWLDKLVTSLLLIILPYFGLVYIKKKNHEVRVDY